MNNYIKQAKGLCGKTDIYGGGIQSHNNTYGSYMLDKKIGDVNGDGIADIVYLTGERGNYNFYEDIKIVIQDGRTMQRYVIPLSTQYNKAYNPWLFLGNFTTGSSDDIMVSLPVGGSGALTYYYIISFRENRPRYILMPEQFVDLTTPLGIEIKYMDKYRVLVESPRLNISYVIDVKDRKELYEGWIYDKAGKLIKPIDGFLIYQPHLNPIRTDGLQPYRLMAQQDIAGTSHADSLGYLITYWGFEKSIGNWVLDPEYFFVMLG